MCVTSRAPNLRPEWPYGAGADFPPKLLLLYRGRGGRGSGMVVHRLASFPTADPGAYALRVLRSTAKSPATT